MPFYTVFGCPLLPTQLSPQEIRLCSFCGPCGFSLCLSEARDIPQGPESDFMFIQFRIYKQVKWLL